MLIYAAFEQIRFQASAQHSVQPTSGSLRDFWQFSAPRQDSVFEGCPHPAHLRLSPKGDDVANRWCAKQSLAFLAG